MSWLLSGQLQSSLGSLKNQVASSLKEVFEAVDEDGDDADLDDPNQDPVEKIELAKSRIRELKSRLEDKSSDVEKLKKQNESLLHLKKVCDVIDGSVLVHHRHLSYVSEFNNLDFNTKAKVNYICSFDQRMHIMRRLFRFER